MPEVTTTIAMWAARSATYALPRLSSFRGIQRVLDGAARYRIALMCAERDPLDCHRTILVARELVARGEHVGHILSDGELEEHSNAMGRLVKRLRLGETDLFRSYADTVDDAYAIQGDAIAYDRDTQRATSPHDEETHLTGDRL